MSDKDVISLRKQVRQLQAVTLAMGAGWPWCS